VLSALQAARGVLTYQELSDVAGCQKDVILYFLTPLCVLGLVERIEAPKVGPGRPETTFRWIGSADHARTTRVRTA